MKILLTAFEAFNGRHTSVSQLAVNGVDLHNSQIEVNKKYLPVALFSSFQCINSYIEKEKPDVIILCGEATNRKKISLEIRAKNLINKKIDSTDEVNLNQKLIIEKGPQSIYSVFPTIEALSHLFTNLIKAEISMDAGAYICNALYYQVMYYYPKIPCIFIHFPLPTNDLSITQMREALEIIIKSL